MKLNSRVLVLNRLWQPVHLCNVRRAFTLLCLGHAHVVNMTDEALFATHDLESWMAWSENHPTCDRNSILTVSCRLQIPEVLLLTFYERVPKQEVRFSRQNIFERDNHTCQYCGNQFPYRQLNLDHVIPRQKGGKTTWENLVCSCIPCNSKKANKLPQEAGMFPLKTPRMPKWRPVFSTGNLMEFSERKSWSHFLPQEMKKRTG